MQKNKAALPALRIPLPDTAIEHRSSSPEDLPHNLYGGVVGLSDGSLMIAYPLHAGLQTGDPVTSESRISRDGGRTWEKGRPLSCPIGIHGLIRLKSNKLAAYGETEFRGRPIYISTSDDDGMTWSKPVSVGAYPDFFPYLHSLSQLSCGRLIFAGYWEGLNAGLPDSGQQSGAPDTYPYTQYGWGLWRGRVLFNEGHRGLEMGINLVYYSDDEGLSWTQCHGGIFGWFDERGIPNGEGGIIDVYEPNVAETSDGRLLMLMRSKTGRLLQSYSHDRGATWLTVLPTELAASQTTPMLIRIPRTGDLLCVWNQVSGEEIRRGFQRGRLSAAVSRDSGRTWENFKTIELQEGMADVSSIAPEFPIPRRLVGRTAMGALPDGFIMFSQPTIDVVQDSVFIRYGRIWPSELEGQSGASVGGNWPRYWPRREGTPPEEFGAAFTNNENVLRIYPVDWFYQ